ncbi:MAG: hypothetical protein RL885_27695 [Planctomycetota bacterium]
MSSELHLDPLSERLRLALTVPDDVCQRLERRALRAPARRFRWRVAVSTFAAATLLALLGIWLWDSLLPRQGLVVFPREVEQALRDDGPLVIEISPSETADRGVAFYDEPTIGWMLEECDGVVYGEVKAVGDAIRFEVSFSQPEWIAGYARQLPKDGAYPVVSCTRALTWKEGERAWLFLKRHPETKRLEVMYDGSGKISPPLWDMFTQDDLFSLITKRHLSAERVAEIVSRHGGQGVLNVESMISWFREQSVPWSAPVIQAALRNQIARFASRDDISHPAVLIRHLDPSGWLMIPDIARDEVRRRFDALDDEWARLAWLEGLHRFRDARGEWPYAPDLDRFIDRAEADLDIHGQKTGYLERIRRAYALLLDIDPPRAIRRLWELYDTVEEAAFWGPVEFLAPLLEHDRERAEAELVRTSGPDRPKKRPLRFDLLAACESSAAQARFAEWLEDDDFDFSSLTYRGQIQRAFIELGDASLYERHRPLLHRLLAEDDLTTGEVFMLTDIVLACEGDLTPALGAIRDVLRRAAEANHESVTELIRLVQKHVGSRRVLWHDPTREEAIAAAKALLGELPR